VVTGMTGWWMDSRLRGNDIILEGNDIILGGKDIILGCVVWLLIEKCIWESQTIK